MNIVCPHCRQELDAEGVQFGEVVCCPACNREFTVEAAPDAAEAQPAVEQSAPCDFFSFSRWLSCSGRAGRKELWCFIVFSVVFSNLLGLIDLLNGDAMQGPLYWIAQYALLVPLWTVYVRRVHDFGRSWKYLLWLLVPFLNVVLAFKMLFMSGPKKPNQYGSGAVPVRIGVPKAPAGFMKKAAIVLGMIVVALWSSGWNSGLMGAASGDTIVLEYMVNRKGMNFISRWGYDCAFKLFGDIGSAGMGRSGSGSESLFGGSNQDSDKDRRACISNMMQISTACMNWACEHGFDAVPKMSDLVGPDNYIREEPKCPVDHSSYSISGDSDGNFEVRCRHADRGHVLPY